MLIAVVVSLILGAAGLAVGLDARVKCRRLTRQLDKSHRQQRLDRAHMAGLQRKVHSGLAPHEKQEKGGHA